MPTVTLNLHNEIADQLPDPCVLFGDAALSNSGRRRSSVRVRAWVRNSLIDLHRGSIIVLSFVI